MADSGSDLPSAERLMAGMGKLLDAYESRYLIASQSPDLDIVPWVNGVEVMLKEIVTQIGLLSTHAASNET